jgi:hypothetical protein
MQAPIARMHEPKDRTRQVPRLRRGCLLHPTPHIPSWRRTRQRGPSRSTQTRSAFHGLLNGPMTAQARTTRRFDELHGHEHGPWRTTWTSDGPTEP